MLVRAFLKPGDEAILPFPSFLMYEIVVRCAGARPVNIPLNLLDSVLNNPQQIVSEKNNRKAYQSKVEFEAGKTFHLNKTAVIKITSLVNQGFHDID